MEPTTAVPRKSPRGGSKSPAAKEKRTIKTWVGGREKKKKKQQKKQKEKGKKKVGCYFKRGQQTRLQRSC